MYLSLFSFVKCWFIGFCVSYDKQESKFLCYDHKRQIQSDAMQVDGTATVTGLSVQKPREVASGQWRLVLFCLHFASQQRIPGQSDLHKGEFCLFPFVSDQGVRN